MEEEFKMDELYHHGVKGQKWGIRRYQNPDGSLTAAGKRKYGTKANFEKVQAAKKKVKVKAKADKVRAKQNARTEKEIAKYEAKYKKKTGEKSDSTKAKSKSISEMSDEELRSKIQRVQLENQLKSLQPEKVSKGKAFMRSLGKDVIAPVAKDIGKQYLTKVLKEGMGLDSKPAKSKEEKAKDSAEYWKNMNTAAQQKEQYEKRMEAEKRQHSLFKDKDSSAKKTDSKSQQKTQDTSEKKKQEDTKSKQKDESAKTTSKESAKEKKTETSKEAKTESKKETFSGEVFGEGTSHSRWASDGKSYTNDYVDAVFKDLSSNSAAVQVYGNIGQSYIAGLLEDKSKK